MTPARLAQHVRHAHAVFMAEAAWAERCGDKPRTAQCLQAAAGARLLLLQIKQERGSFSKIQSSTEG